jgi:ribosomal protein S15P/S13E
LQGAEVLTLTINLLDYLIQNNNDKQSKNRKLSNYINKIAKLGGYLARASDPPPGNIVMWRGLSRLTDIELGFNLAIRIMGN